MVFSFSSFVIFVDIFKVLECVLLIFHIFEFSHHISGPTVYISHFSRFQCFSLYSWSYQVFFSIFFFVSFLPYSISYSVYLLFFTFFSYSRHIPRHTVFVSHFPRFSVFFAKIQVLQCVFLIFHIFTVSRYIPGPKTFCFY